MQLFAVETLDGPPSIFQSFRTVLLLEEAIRLLRNLAACWAEFSAPLAELFCCRSLCLHAMILFGNFYPSLCLLEKTLVAKTNIADMLVGIRGLYLYL